MTKIRIANGSRPWVSGHITIDYAGKTANGKPYVLFHVFARNKRIARFQIKGSQIYELVNAIVDATESVTVSSPRGEGPFSPIDSPGTGSIGSSS